ncbi:MAG TPA: ECF-type sigma factor [Bryobacteraceae bacterium]|nr:ECF-type sigma factor [Bryobacteraceae bacterium]
MTDQPGEITVYLRRLKDGDPSAEGDLAGAVYGRMLELGRATMAGRANSLSLQPTALVNQVLLELLRARTIDWQDRTHFFRIAARLLRRRLIDHIRSASASKRPPPGQRIDFDEMFLPAEERFEEILSVHEGLEKLAELDPHLAELIEMIYFGGISIETAASIRGVTTKTIYRHLDLGYRLLSKILGSSRHAGDPSHAISFDRR